MLFYHFLYMSEQTHQKCNQYTCMLYYKLQLMPIPLKGEYWKRFLWTLTFDNQSLEKTQSHNIYPMFLVVNFHMMVNNYMKTMKWVFLKSCSSHFSWFFIHSRKKLLNRNWPLCFTITWWFSLYLLPPTFPVVTFRCCATQTNWFQMVLELVSIYSPHETRLSASSVSQLFPFAVVLPLQFLSLFHYLSPLAI